MTIPYTYLVGWSVLDLWYYGVRYANGCCPSDLMISYPTSSVLVKQTINEQGLPDVIQIRQTFKSKEEAISWEHRVLQRMKVVRSHRWLNQHDNRCFSWDTNPMLGRRHTTESKDKMKLNSGNKGRRIGYTNEYRPCARIKNYFRKASGVKREG